jgi:hypothetical protein
MKSSHFHTQSWTSGTSPGYPGFPEIHPYLDEDSLLSDEMIQSSDLAAEKKADPHQPGKTKVLFKFFDGWPMPKS